MPGRRAIICCCALTLLLGIAALGVSTPQAVAGPLCAPTDTTPDPSMPGSPSAGNPCWTDVTPYPFGVDGNPVNPTSTQCGTNPTAFGPSWPGNFIEPTAGGDEGCYLAVTSMAFRAWNRGLAATSPVDRAAQNGWAAKNAFGVWLFNGTRWFPDPTFPGAGTCPGTVVLWAGKLDYWLIGPSRAEGADTGTSGQTVCRFDGVNLQWEVLTLPAATLARFPVSQPFGQQTFKPVGGINGGACYSWDNCWFFGTAGAVVHWDGQVLTDASPSLAESPWRAGDFTAAVARTDPLGNAFGLAVARSSSDAFGIDPLPAEPDGSPPPQLYASHGGPFTPTSFSPPATPRSSQDPYTTDFVAIDADPQGDVWIAGGPSARMGGSAVAPAPLLRVTEDGAAIPCGAYGAITSADFHWRSLSVFSNDGSALAGASSGYSDNRGRGFEPVLLHAACDLPPPEAVTRFRIPDPFVANQQTAPWVPADPYSGSSVSVGPVPVAANAANDAWMATPPGLETGPATVLDTWFRPHLYRWTDGQPLDPPAGEDYEPRPSLFTLDAPIFIQPPPVVVVTTTTTTVTRHGKPRKRRLKPAVYDIKTLPLRKGNGGMFTLYITFKVRRPVTLGVEALKGRQIVSRSGLKRFRGRQGELALTLDPHRWPTGIKFVTPRGKRG